MIIPSIDIIRGRTVQLVGGREQVLDAGDPLAWLTKFSVAGEVAVVDLDAARGEGSNRELIARMCALAPIRVGGGIRDIESARWWLDAGASRIVIGTAAEPELLQALPRERVIVALDAEDGVVVVNGWRSRTGRTVEQRMEELRGLAAGFLVTFVEREGRLGGTDLARASRLAELAASARITIAGGVTTAAEIAALDRLGADAQVGMALYTARLSLGEAIAAPLVSDRADGLVPTVVVDEHGYALGLAWSSAESIAKAVELRRGVYQSRRRGLWIKGEESGATQELLRIEVDCDRDALRFTVRQQGSGFCHQGTYACWGDAPPLSQLERTLRLRAATPTPGSYTNRLLDDPALLRDKLVEEAQELADASAPSDVAAEAADLMYFALVRMAAAGVGIADAERELARRALRVTRRRGESKRAVVGGAP